MAVLFVSIPLELALFARAQPVQADGNVLSKNHQLALCIAHAAAKTGIQ